MKIGYPEESKDDFGDEHDEEEDRDEDRGRLIPLSLFSSSEEKKDAPLAPDPLDALRTELDVHQLRTRAVEVDGVDRDAVEEERGNWTILPFFKQQSDENRNIVYCSNFPIVQLQNITITYNEHTYNTVYVCTEQFKDLTSDDLKDINQITREIGQTANNKKKGNDNIYWTNYEKQMGMFIKKKENENKGNKTTENENNNNNKNNNSSSKDTTGSMPSIYVQTETFNKDSKGDIIEPPNKYHIPADMSVYKYTSGSQEADLVYVTFSGDNLGNNIDGAYVYFVSSSSSGELPYTFLTLYHYENLDSENVTGIDVNELQKKLRSQNTSISNIFILGEYNPGVYACIFYPVRLDVLLKDVQPEYDLSKKFFNNYKSN